MQPIVVTVGPLAASSANNIALSQTPGAAGNLTLNGSTVVGGVAILDTPREVLITTTGDEHTKSFVITGTDWAGSVISETVSGISSGTAKASVLSYATVTSIHISAAAAAALTVGTNGVASSPWIRMDGWAGNVIAVQGTASGTVNYTVQQTLDDPNSPTNPVAPNLVTWLSCPVTALTAATGSIFGSYTSPPVFIRALLNSQTNPGFVTLTVQQSGSVTY